ncbi:MAG: dTMP kinase [Bacillota bacterium]|nr:dTMP kinase [Bacillota bacterium]
MGSGRLITFEGPDGSGKTTQLELLKTFLTEKGFSVLFTREPGGTRIGEKLRQIILDKEHQEMDAVTEVFLYAAARAQHVSELIKPAMAAGKLVVCDRFVDSSIAYQAWGRSLGNMVAEINRWAAAGLMPDLTFLLMVAPEAGRTRLEQGRTEELDRLEREPAEYRQRVCEGYRTLAEQAPERIVFLDGTRSIESLQKEIRERTLRLLEEDSPGKEGPWEAGR